MIGRMRQAWPPGIRAQLALLYTGVFALLFLLIGGAYYAYLQNALQQSFASALEARTQLISSGISLENGAVCIQDVAGLLPGLNAVAPCGQQDSPAPSATEPPGSATGARQSGAQGVNYGDLVRILDRSGIVVYSSRAFGALAIPQTSVQQPLHGGPAWSGMVTARNGADV
jgi:two-component system, OmpR family, sensor kinase